jgi:hypothetical protein
MPELISGPTMILSWIWSGGTVVLNSDYRSVSFNPSIAYEEVTAGSDTQVGRISTIKDATASIELVMQTGGTAMATALQPGVSGTLLIQPEGTAVGKRKISLPCYCDGHVPSFPYANLAVISCGFTGSSTIGNFTDGSN